MATIGIKLIAISIAINGRDFRHDYLTSREYWFNTYDYIVVGAGTAGVVVAARLAEDITKTVLLLEAGGPQNSSTDIPALRPSLVGTDVDWNYDIVPQSYAYFSRKDSQIPVSSGKVFGGTSTLSDLNYYRESPEYFKAWHSVYGIRHWSYEEVLPFFLKSENNLDAILVQTQNGTHRSGGLMTVSTANPDPIVRKYLMAADSLGYNESDVNGKQPFGVTLMQTYITRDGIALSTASAYLETKHRPNLHTFGNALVTKVLFDRHNHCTGVKFQKEGSYSVVRARKEVILSAGAVGSAQLLLLSGIGPKEQLNALKIPIISGRSVGTGVKHSLSVELNYNIKDQNSIEKPLANTDSEYEYYTEHTGPLAYKASGVHCFNEVPEEGTGLSNGCVLPYVHLLGDNIDKHLSRLHLRTEWEEYYRPYLNHSVFKLKAVLRRPKSTGSLSLEADNAFVKPLIDPRVFVNQSDVDEMVETIKQAMRVYHSEYLSPFIEPFHLPVPGCEHCTHDKYCDSYLRCIVYTLTDQLSLSGTCRMGGAQDKHSVVDERFRVKGVTGLRVIDASVLPVPTDQMMAIVVMLAERGVNFIEEEHKNPLKLKEIQLNWTKNNTPLDLPRV